METPSPEKLIEHLGLLRAAIRDRKQQLLADEFFVNATQRAEALERHLLDQMEANQLTVDAVVGQCVAVRDAQKAQADALAEEHKAVTEAQERRERWMLGALNQAGVDSAKTEHGTAYKTTIRSVGVEDWTKVLDYVCDGVLDTVLEQVEANAPEEAVRAAFREAPVMQLFNRAVNKTGAIALETATGELPPGLKSTQITSVNVRRS